MNEPPRSPVRSADADPEALPRANAAGAALQALARAARSIVLYDPGNATVRYHLAEYQARMHGFLRVHHTLAARVAPFHIAVAGHIAYEDRDREKSLAFRLYRDGIRALRVLSHAPWEELLALLQIIAVRYAAIRDQEEDTVTLLRRAEFKGIEFDSVEGFTPKEEIPEPEVDVELDHARLPPPPPGWDTPLQKLPAPGPLSYRDVPPEALAPFRDEGDERAIGALAVSLARDLLAESARGGWPTPNRDLVAFFGEIRDTLLVDGDLVPLRELIDILAQAGASDLRDLMLRGIGDEKTLDLVLEAVPDDSDKLPAHLVPFLPLLGVSTALDRLAAPLTEGRRALLVKVVLARLPREADMVLARLPALEPEVVRALATGIVTRAPERAAEVARQLLSQRQEALRLEGMHVIEIVPAAIPLRPILALLDDGSGAMRLRAAEVLGKRGDDAAFDALCAALESNRALGEREIEAIGRALAEIAPIRAARLFAGWLDVKGGFLRRLTPEQRAHQWAAVAGTGILPGEDADDALTLMAARTDGALRRHCLATLARRRKEGDRRG